MYRNLALLFVSIFACITFNAGGGQFLRCKGTIELPECKNGFTCTGAYYDDKNNMFYVGNIGKESSQEKEYHSKIVVMSEDIKEIKKEICLYKIFPEMSDVQGITKDGEGNIWFCASNDNFVKCITENGDLVKKLYCDSYTSGIDYDRRSDTLWILNQYGLENIDLDGNTLKKYKIKAEAKDQIFLDEENNIILITVGDNYNLEQNLYVFDIAKERITKKFQMENCYAVEGVCVVGNTLYIFNDGIYHMARISKNYCVKFDYNELLSKIF